MKGYCMVCGVEIEVHMCCSGYMCGCMGMPTEPPICSEECYIEYQSLPVNDDKLDDSDLEIDIDIIFP